MFVPLERAAAMLAAILSDRRRGLQHSLLVGMGEPLSIDVIAIYFPKTTSGQSCMTRDQPFVIQSCSR
jgi:hypothetical protein